MADQKLSALSAIPTSDINNNTLLYVVDTVGTDTSYQVTRSSLYLAVANTWTAQQTITVVASTALVINIPTGPTGGSTKFIGALSVVAQTVAFATTAQTGDYVTNEIGQATLTNPTAGTITNASSLLIDGAPIASTNVTITNARSLWVKSGLSEFDGNIVMSGANISLGRNAITTTSFTLQDVGNSTFIMTSTSAVVSAAFEYKGINPVLGLFDTTSAQTTPNKYIQSFQGTLRILNSAENAVIMAWSDAGLISTYKNISTAGNGIPVIYGTVGLGVNLNTTSTTIASYTPATTGFFSVRIAISCKTSSTVTLTISYTDPQAGTITSQSIYSKALTGGTTDSLTFNVYASTAAAITVSGTDSVALGDAYASAQVEQLQ